MDFLGGTVVKNPPANAEDTGSSLGPGISHMLWCTTTPVRLEPVLCNKRSHRKKPTHSSEDPTQP